MKADVHTLHLIASILLLIFYAEFIAIAVIFYACAGSGPINYVSGRLWLFVGGVGGLIFTIAMQMLACSEKFLAWEILFRLKILPFVIWWGLGFHLVTNESEMFCTLLLVHVWIAVVCMIFDLIVSLVILYRLPLPLLPTRRIQTL
jgi:hypothetical protein